MTSSKRGQIANLCHSDLAPTSKNFTLLLLCVIMSLVYKENKIEKIERESCSKNGKVFIFTIFFATNCAINTQFFI